MNARARAVIGVVLMSALLVLYFVFAGIRAFALLGSGTPVAIAMGVAMLLLPLIGVWALVRELQFGRAATRLTDLLEAEGSLPVELTEEGIAAAAAAAPESSPRQSVREISDAAFPRYRAEVEADPTSWQAWMRLGLIYDGSGDRRRARHSIRQAIAQNRNEIRR